MMCTCALPWATRISSANTFVWHFRAKHCSATCQEQRLRACYSHLPLTVTSAPQLFSWMSWTPDLSNITIWLRSTNYVKVNTDNMHTQSTRAANNCPFQLCIVFTFPEEMRGHFCLLQIQIPFPTGGAVAKPCSMSYAPVFKSGQKKKIQR